MPQILSYPSYKLLKHTKFQTLTFKQLRETEIWKPEIGCALKIHKKIHLLFLKKH